MTAISQPNCDASTRAPIKRGHKAQNAWTLNLLWKNAVGDVYGEFAPDLTAKQRGQLALLIKKAPPDTAGDVLDACAKNWIDFVKQAQADAAALNLPSKPDIGFLLRFIGVAVNFAQTRKAALTLMKPVPRIAMPPVPSVETHTRQKAGGDKATLAEVLTILKDIA